MRASHHPLSTFTHSRDFCAVHKNGKNAPECRRGTEEGEEGEGEQADDATAGNRDNSSEAVLYEEIALTPPQGEEAIGEAERVRSARGSENHSRDVVARINYRIFSEHDDFTEVKAVIVVEPTPAPVPDAAEEAEDAKVEGSGDDEAVLLSRLLSVTKAARNKLARSKSFSSSTALRLDITRNFVNKAECHRWISGWSRRKKSSRKRRWTPKLAGTKAIAEPRPLRQTHSRRLHLRGLYHQE